MLSESTSWPLFSWTSEGRFAAAVPLLQRWVGARLDDFAAAWLALTADARRSPLARRAARASIARPHRLGEHLVEHRSARAEATGELGVERPLLLDQQLIDVRRGTR